MDPVAVVPAPVAVPAPEGVVVPAAPVGAPASLYVGDLDPSVTEATLFEKFSAIGPIASIRVCRDTVTRLSLGYAYVNFHNHDDAQKAIDDMNFDPIKNKPCRIMWSQRDPSMRKSGLGNIFIKNLQKDIDNKTLYDTFTQFGEILSCKVVEDHNGESKGYGFVHFKTAEGAAAAIAQVDGMQLGDQIVSVSKFLTRQEREEAGFGTKKFTNVFFKNLPEDLTEEELKAFAEKEGKTTSLVIKKDSDGKSKCFGFVNYEDPECAKKAVENLHETELKGKTLYVARAQKAAERRAALKREYDRKRKEYDQKFSGVNLYVKNIDETVTDDQLREAFAKFGTITSAKVMLDGKGASRGFGFVCFSSPEEATKAVTEMNTQTLGTKPLYVALAQRKQDRKQILAQQAEARSMRHMQQSAMPGPFQGPMAFYGQPMAYGPRGYMQPVPMRWNMQGGVQGGAQQSMPQQAGRGAGSSGRRSGGQQGGRGGGPGVPQQRGAGGAKYAGRGGVPAQAAPVAAAPVGTPAPQAAVLAAGQAPLTASALAAASEGDQKRMLGERLYPRIHEVHPEQAGKITGMLLEMDNSELLHLLEDSAALNEKVSEAMEVLRAHASQ